MQNKYELKTRAKVKYGSNKIVNAVLYPTGETVDDKTGKRYQIFQRYKQQYYVDIPTNKCQFGIIVDGNFFLMFESQAFTTHYFKMLNKIRELSKRYSFDELIKEMV